MLVEIAKFGKEERAVCTSLDIAETFGKEHKNVLRDVENLGCSEEFNRLNFEPISYTDSMNRMQKAYTMTRDGFTLLVMGYTGDLAMKFKEAYIKQFNAMEAALQGKRIEREKGIAVRQALTKLCSNPVKMIGCTDTPIPITPTVFIKSCLGKTPRSFDLILELVKQTIYETVSAKRS
ncbi:MAG: Rha family transcriptional regulator [Clostridia bacterium]